MRSICSTSWAPWNRKRLNSVCGVKTAPANCVYLGADRYDYRYIVMPMRI